MSTNRNRNPPREPGSAEQRLARLLDTPFFLRVLPRLAPETLHQLVQYRGLDACGELVASATPAQLTALLDLDLWRRPEASGDERFDADRFGDWLEVLVDTGDAVAARTIAALDTRLVIAGLSHYLRVFDPGTFEPTASSDDEPRDRSEMMNSEPGGDAPEYEVGGYLVRARRTDTWDAIVTLLSALEAEHNHCFHAVMQGCRRLSNSRPEIDGLDDLLGTPEQHLHEVAIERERRQSRQGYATSADARAFLQMARQRRDTSREPGAIRASAAFASPSRRAATAGSPATRPIGINPIVTAYFRAADERPDATPADAPTEARETASRQGGSHDPADGEDIRTAVEDIIELLAKAGEAPAPPRALLAPAGGSATRLGLFTQLMEFVRHQDEAAYLTRIRELAFLANTLLAGCSVQSRLFSPREASDATACICNLGLECWPTRWPGATPNDLSSPGEPDTAGPADAFLVDHDLVTVFEVGWSVLYHDVSLFVADQLVPTLADLRRVDADTDRGLRALRRTLEKQREAGTPWLARGAADVLAALDTTAWVSVLGLLDECPILPAALTAVLERQRTPVSPTAFAFISTATEIADIRRFMRVLPDLLSR